MVMCSCPECDKPIPAKTIFLAACPLWLVCPSCRANLIGSRVVKAQALFAVALAVSVGIPAAHWIVLGEEPIGTRILLFLGGTVAFGLVFGVPMVLVTLRYGKYVVRQPGDFSMTRLVVVIVCIAIGNSVLEKAREDLSSWERSFIVAAFAGVVLLALEGWRIWRRRPGPE